MDTDLLREKLLSFVKENKLVVVLGSAGLIFFIYGLISLLPSSSSSNDLQFSSSESSNQQLTPEQLRENSLVVDIEGAVVKPGVYTLSPNARVQDALIAAGGLSQAADREWITKHYNLAAKLVDGNKLYFPFLGENTTQSVGGATQPQSVSVDGIGRSEQSSLININSATEQELDTLPGIGPVTAQKMISNRPYGAIEDLTSKKVVTSKVFEKIKDKITAY